MFTRWSAQEALDSKKTYLHGATVHQNSTVHLANRNEINALLGETVEHVRCRKPYRRTRLCEGTAVGHLEAGERWGWLYAGRGQS